MTMTDKDKRQLNLMRSIRKPAVRPPFVMRSREKIYNRKDKSWKKDI